MFQAGTAHFHPDSPTADALRIVLSFDIEEHFRIEAAAGLDVGSALKVYYRGRLEPTTRWLIDELAARDIRATFFVVGEIAQHSPGLIRVIQAAGHEVASHGWDHRRLHTLTPATFREDLHKSKDALEQVTGQSVVGYRAPTFSLVRETSWAIDVMIEEGLLYDSSIFPIRHDRYGIPGAPRQPFCVRGQSGKLIELPLTTLRVLGKNLPAAGGGYFRLMPLSLMQRAIAQTRRDCRPAVAMLYFHPWEFDPGQTRLPLGRLSGFRTYVGIGRSKQRLVSLLDKHRFTRARDVAYALASDHKTLSIFDLGNGSAGYCVNES
jgi:polysaccharide deacetylase family protein (PEP-CTERM system associated)